MITITGGLLMLSNPVQRRLSPNVIQLVSKNDETVRSVNSQTEINHTSAKAIPANWKGKYTAYFSYGDIAGQNAGWALEIVITDHKITAKGEGFQMAFLDELTAKVSGSKLILTHLKNISGYKRGKAMKPEFVLTKDQSKYYVRSEWIDGNDVKAKLTALGYQIDKEN